MREILFRAKRVDNGEWVSGSLIRCADDTALITVSNTKLFTQGNGAVALNGAYDVDPSTVGQYTGLKDKLGKDIFEGDILFDSEWECEGHVAWANEHLSWMIVMSGEKEFLQEFITDGEAMCAGCTHIIGNIHDNPEELLEVSHV